jgi:hypothetical protein
MLTIQEARLAVRLSSTDFDGELQDLMNAAVLDLNTAGIAEQDDDRLYNQALRMYLKGHWEPGAPEAADCRKIYEDIKGTLKHSSKYREVAADA